MNPLCSICGKEADYRVTTSDDYRLFEERHLCAEHEKTIKPAAYMCVAYLHVVSREAICEALEGAG